MSIYNINSTHVKIIAEMTKEIERLEAEVKRLKKERDEAVETCNRCLADRNAERERYKKELGERQ